MARLALASVLVLCFVFAHDVSAQSINIERFRPSLDRFGFLGIQGSATPGHLRWNLALWSWYSNRSLRVRPGDGTTENAIKHQLTSDVLFQLGLFGRWSLALEIPLVLYQQGGTTVPLNGRTSFDGFALQDPRFTTKVRIVGEKTEKSQDKPDGPGLALLASIPVPIGNEGLYAGESQFTFDLQALGDFHILETGAGAMLGWRYRPNVRQVGTARLQQELLYGFSIKPPIPKVLNLYGLLEFRGSTAFRGSQTNTLEGDLGVRYTKNAVTLTAAFGGGLVRGLGQPAFRAFFGVSYSPQTHDLDQDGIPDSEDECPRLPEDIDGFEDDDGCMDPDNDNDFIPDADDKCPNVEALEGQDEDEDGCTDP
ncbi:MAG: hypothetical protein AAF500_11780 [Myxococcota bacterium]